MEHLVILRLDVASDPISGTVSDDGAIPAPFTGYVELIAALERVRNMDLDAGLPPAEAV